MASKSISLQGQNRELLIPDASSFTNCPRWTAICRGAVLKGVTNIKTSNVLVQSRISRCSYGHLFRDNFDKSKHLNSDRYWDEVTETYRARNQLAWYLRRGEVVTTGKPVRKNWHRHVEWSKEDDFYLLKEDIYSSSETPPPSRLMEGVTRCGMITPDGRINLSRMSVVKGKDAKRYRKIEFETEMTVIGLFFLVRRQKICKSDCTARSRMTHFGGEKADKPAHKRRSHYYHRQNQRMRSNLLAQSLNAAPRTAPFQTLHTRK